MNEKLKEFNVEFLFRAILELRDMEECYKFFEDLCTVQELRALAQRIQVAKMLSESKVYSDIVAQTGASTATISRVNRSLHYGCDGYTEIFARLKEKEKESTRAVPVKPRAAHEKAVPSKERETEDAAK
ncbi:MAG TPA: TrpR-like protein, YerC/YecD [Candidatus Merdivicinus faecavium]|nr:TrpR-like protein, YerC/YecD [Candidatus Merdivicinus faecavium]